MKENFIIILIIILILLIIGIFAYIRYVGSDAISKIFNIPQNINQEVCELNNTVNKCVNQMKDTQLQNIHQIKKISLLNNQPITKIANHYTDLMSDFKRDVFPDGPQDIKCSQYYMSENTKESGIAPYCDSDSSTSIDSNLTKEDFFNNVTDLKTDASLIQEIENLEVCSKEDFFNNVTDLKTDAHSKEDFFNNVTDLVNEDPVEKPIIISTKPIVNPEVSQKKSIITIKTEVLEEDDIKIDFTNLKSITNYDNTEIKNMAKQLKIPLSYKENNIRKIYKKEELYKKIKSHIKKYKKN